MLKRLSVLLWLWKSQDKKENYGIEDLKDCTSFVCEEGAGAVEKTLMHMMVFYLTQRREGGAKSAEINVCKSSHLSGNPDYKQLWYC